MMLQETKNILKYYKNMDTFLKLIPTTDIEEVSRYSFENVYNLDPRTSKQLSNDIFEEFIEAFNYLNSFEIDFYHSVGNYLDEYSDAFNFPLIFADLEPEISPEYIVDSSRGDLYDSVTNSMFPLKLVNIAGQTKDMSFKDIWYDSDDGASLAKLDACTELEHWVTLAMCNQTNGSQDYIISMIAINCVFFKEFKTFVTVAEYNHHPGVKWFK